MPETGASAVGWTLGFGVELEYLKQEGFPVVLGDWGPLNPQEAATTVSGEMSATHTAVAGTLGTDVVATTLTEDLVAEQLLTPVLIGV